jgi:hypothetical protein
MYSAVSTNVSALCKPLAAYLALVRSLSAMPALVGLEVSKLRETLIASFPFARLLSIRIVVRIVQYENLALRTGWDRT